MNEQEAITAYLDDAIDAGPISLLIAGIRDARSGYDHAALWLGAIGYLIVCEQIGHTIARPETSAAARDGSRAAFVLALADFGPGELGEQGRHALYDMRCAMAHRYGLQNEGSSARVFAYTTSGPLVRLAEEDWDGTVEGAVNLKMTTVVNLLALRDMVEGLYENVRSMHEDGGVALVLGLDPNEVSALLRMRIANSWDELGRSS